MSFSAGLLNVQTLNVPGGAGSIAASNLNFNDLNVANDLTVGDALSVTGATHVGGVFDVSGNAIVYGSTTLNTLSTGATQVSGSLDVSGNSNVKGNLTLGTNSVVRSDGSGNFVVQGNVLATGSLVTNYNPSYPALNAASNWEGIWDTRLNSSASASYSYSGLIAMVIQPNNTYTLYTNSCETKNYNFYSKFQQFKLLATNVVPVFTKDLSGNVTENHIRIPTSFANKAAYPTSNLLVSRLLTVADTSSNYAFYIGGFTASGASYTPVPVVRVLFPTDVTPIAGADWFSSYQTNYNEERQENKTHVEVFDDLEGTYNQFRDTVITGYQLTDNFTDIITGEKRILNKLSPSAFAVMNKFKKLKTDADVYNLNINYIHRGVYTKPNVMTLHYDWKVYNQATPLASPVQEITLINKGSPGSPVIGDIPLSFKFLPSFIEFSTPKQNHSGIQEPSEWFMDNFVGVRLPLEVVGDKVLTITTSGPTGDYDVIPGVYTVTIPSGYYYPHSLATYVTQNINIESGLRLGFYTPIKNWISDQTYADSSGGSFYYLSSGLNSINSVDVSCNDISFLTDVLGLNTLSVSQNPNPAPITKFVPPAAYVTRGGFPMYTYNGNEVDPDNLWTPQSVPSCPPGSSGLYNLSFSIGNVITSNNPRDYYNVMYYFMNLFQQEEHSTVRFIPTLQDIDQEWYLPDTWEEAQYTFVNFNAPHCLNWCWRALGIVNTIAVGTQGPNMFKVTNKYNNNTTTEVDTGYTMVSSVFNGYNYTTTDKLLKTEFYNNSISDQNGYTFTNYLDLSNCFIDTIKFQSTVTDLLSQSVSSYWMNKFSNGTLPADVTTSAATILYTQLADVSSNLVYGIQQAYGHLMGIMKQSVANAILPPDASGSVVGYLYYGSYIGVANSVRMRDIIVSLFKSKGVKYCVVDQRNNFGGNGLPRLVPFGVNPNFFYTFFSTCSGINENGAPTESSYYVNSSTFWVDVLANPTKYPSAWRLAVDSSGATTGVISNHLYLKSGNPYEMQLRFVTGNPGGNTVDGSNNGQGIFNFTFLNSSNSLSATQAQIFRQKGFSDNSEHPQLNGTLGENPTVNCMVYGVNNKYLFESHNSFAFDVDAADTINPGNGGSLTQDIFYNSGDALQFNISTDVSGVAMQSFNNPSYKYDALANYTPKTFMTEIGVYYDASGNQQAYLDGSRNAFNVSNDNTASYRDFRLERALQCTYAQRAGCRAESKFGYMPYDSTDPYNWAITDTSGAMPLPVNPFGL
jgi:hypothetical protein